MLLPRIWYRRRRIDMWQGSTFWRRSGLTSDLQVLGSQRVWLRFVRRFFLDTQSERATIFCQRDVPDLVKRAHRFVCVEAGPICLVWLLQVFIRTQGSLLKERIAFCVRLRRTRTSLSFCYAPCQASRLHSVRDYIGKFED
jgi:hypothetical protein